ncbi:translocation/assembly module TamB domain-containing protein [Alkalilacustris brevis]|uniref:translocation/assembly module TamB domain-containing protein n=1 Tax=Alkalilacustris brevis TaxID=2026338 RepID=UPI000E0CC1C8|nr:translocation/assembly module TamB domain-containing protein [Alkalilacustris brevis]
MLERIIARLVLIVSLALVPALPATANEEDASFLTRTLQDFLSDAGREVRIIGFEGALSSRATIREMTIADEDGVWLTLRGAVLDWNRAALLRRQVEVNELAAEEIILERMPGWGASQGPSPEATPFALPELPVSLRVGQVSAGRVVLGEALFGAEAVVTLDGGAQLAGGEGSANIAIERVDGEMGALTLDGAYSNATRILSLDLHVREAEDGIAANLLNIPGRPDIALSIAGEGLLDDFVAQIGLETDGQERLSGEVALLSEGDDDAEDPAARTQRFRAALGGDIAPLFAPEFRDFFGEDIRVEAEGARFPDGRMELSTLDLRANALRLIGNVAIGADGLPELIQLHGEIADPESRPVLLPAAGPRTRIDRARLDLDFDAARGEDWRGDISVAGFSRPGLGIGLLRLTGEGQITAASMPGAVPGLAAAFDFAAEGLAPGDPALAEALGERVRGNARLNWEQGGALTLERLVLSGRDYGLSGTAQLRGLDMALELEARLLALHRFSALAGRELGGALSGQVEGDVELFSGAFDLRASVNGRDLRADQPELDRLLQGASSIEADLRRDADGTHIDRFALRAQQLEADLDGFIGSLHSRVSGTVDLADLSVLGAGYGGALAAEGRFADTDGAQSVHFTAEGQDLTVGIAQLDRLLRGESTLRLDATHQGGDFDIAHFALSASALSAEARGRIAEKASDLVAEFRFSDLAALGAGYGGTLDAQAHLFDDGSDRRLSLEAEARDLALGLGPVDRLWRGRSQLSLAGFQRGELFELDRFTLENPQLTASASAEVEGARRLMDLSVRLADLGLIVPELRGPVTFGGQIVDGPGDGYALDLSGTGPGGIDARVTGNMARDLTADLAITGTANLALSNPFHEPVNVQGLAQYDLRIQGRPGLDTVSGTVTTSGARAVAPQQGVTLEEISGSAQLGGGSMQVDAAAQVQGGGSLGINGSIGLQPGVLPADLSVTLDRARISDRRIFETRVSGNLAITGGLLRSQGRIAGDLFLDGTEVRIPSSGLGAGEYIPNLIHVNESAASLATRRAARVIANGRRADGREPNAFTLDVALSSPNRVFVRGRGLDAELGGTLRLTGTTLDVVPSGEFTLLRGRLDILGRRFTLSDGVARLQGRFVPFIRLTATTTTDGITASIVFAGEADAMQISFISSPELPEEEIVARLLFGRELSRLSPFQAAQLASAVATLAGRGGEGLVGNLRESFGLDDLDISTGDDGTAALRVGRYLTENVYTDVTVDAEGRSEVSLNLDLSPSVSVRGRTDSEGRSGVGVFFERDY